MTEVELNKKERKASEVSNNDSDMVLSSEDHFNGFSNDEKKSSEKEKESVEQDTEADKDKQTNTEKEEAQKVEENLDQEPTQKLEDSPANKSINDLINNEQVEENVTQINENTEKNKNRIELLDYLLSFVESEKELNYVLTGYFSKFFNLLLNKFPHKIIGYIYLERPEILFKFIDHSQKKSISELLPKLLLLENHLGGDKTDKSNLMDRSSTTNAFTNLNSPLQLNIESISNTRRSVLVHLFQKLSLQELDSEVTSNLSAVIVELFENRSILEMILKEKVIIDHIFGLLAQSTPEANFTALETSDMNYNYCEILNIFIHILRYSQLENLKCPTYKSENEDLVNSENDQTIDNTLLGECILTNLDKILGNFLPEVENINSTESTSKTIDGTFGLPFKPLGLKRVKLLEMVCYLLFYFKNVQSVIDKILIKSEFLKYLIQYFFQYEWNNTYQLHFETLVKHYFNNISNHPEITKYLFEDLNILEIFITHGNENKVSHYDEKGFCFNSSRKINHGYFAILVDLCHKLSQIEQSVSGLKESYFTEEWQIFLKEKVNYWKKKFDSKLCVPETQNSTYMTDGEFSSQIDESLTKEDMKSEEVVEDNTCNKEESNPFPKKEEFTNNENEDWFSPKTNEDNKNNDKIFDDINNNFEFVDDKNYTGKSSKDDMFLREMENNSVEQTDQTQHVEKSEQGNYTDTEFWKGHTTNTLSVDSIKDCLNDLEG